MADILWFWTYITHTSFCDISAYNSKIKTNINLVLVYDECLCQHCLLIHMNRPSKTLSLKGKNLSSIIYRKFYNKEVFPKFLYKLMFDSFRASATFVSHRCPFSVAASQQRLLTKS